MRIAVIGLGGVGSAAARFLAEARHEVVGFEQHALGHERGSSHGESRIYRLAYARPPYTSLMQRALPLWRDLAAEAGEDLVVACGGLYVGPPDHADVAGVRDGFVAAGLAFDELDAAGVARRFPALRLRDGEVALHQADAGFLRATRCVLANARLARAKGATLHEGARVAAVEPARDAVRVLSDAGAQEFDHVVVSAGPWVARLLPEAGLPLAVTRQQFAYLRIREDHELFEPSRLPVWIDASVNEYGFPSDGRLAGVKVAAHSQGEPFDPERPDRPVDREVLASLVERSVQRFPGLSPDVLSATACLYTNAPDEDFVVGPAPGMERVTLVSACSGHGFKFTVLMGKIAARLACDADPGVDLEGFSPARFG